MFPLRGNEECRACCGQNTGIDKGYGQETGWTAKTSFVDHAKKHGARQSRTAVLQKDIFRDRVRKDRMRQYVTPV